ncbi:MAG: DUF4364 family protein [Clostridia bacterium]|nr:DUF4364 family protein [Clostridia bacterium]
MRIEPPRRTPEDEQRLIVLYSLMHLGPCTDTQLLQFLAEQNLTNYFEMMFALNDLCDRGQAARQKRRAGTYYMATQAGDEALRLFGGRVPQSLKNVIAEQGALWRQRFKTEAQLGQEIRKTPRGDYELTLTVTEKDAEMMRISLCVPSREIAYDWMNRWPGRASQIYGAVIRALAEDEKP